MPKLPSQKKPSNKSEYRQVWVNECRELIMKYHYSHRMPAAVKLAYGMVDYGPPRKVIACCIFSFATGRWETDNLWELTRLARTPDFADPLTKLISIAMGHIRKNKLTDLVVSFADAEEDHHGGIYQSASWVYDGMRGERLDGINIDDRFIPARTCNAMYGTSSPDALKAKFPDSVVEPHFDMGKHCYWKALSKDGMRRAISLGLKSRPYPKPMLNQESTGNYVVENHRRKGVINLPTLERQVTKEIERADGEGESLL